MAHDAGLLMDALYSLSSSDKTTAFYVSQGCDRREISERMGITNDAAKCKLGHVYKALGINSDTCSQKHILAMIAIRKLIA